MKAPWKVTLPLIILAVIGIGYSLIGRNMLGLEAAAKRSPTPLAPFDWEIRKNALEMLQEGRDIFRFDTFGDETFWGDQLKLHEAIAQASPKMALGLGLKVDLAALPHRLIAQLRQGTINLDDPMVTLALLKLNAVVGVTGFLRGDSLRSIGIQCALCHSTVDKSFSAPGIPEGNIGHRLDGWANRDLNVGAIVALAPNLKPFTALLQIVNPSITDDDVRTVLHSWGPGKFDAELILDGKTENPDTGMSAATLLPPAFGLAGVNNHTWTGAWGTVTYWNAFVANLEMHGQGTFFDPRLKHNMIDEKPQFPIAAAMGFDNVRHNPDLITAKLPALHFYQLAIPAPKPLAGSFDAEAAVRGTFSSVGRPTARAAMWSPSPANPAGICIRGRRFCIENFQADRAPDRRYRTAPLNGLWTHQQGGFYHDGRFPMLLDVVNHYDRCFSLRLTNQEKQDLVQYLLSLPNEK